MELIISTLIKKHRYMLKQKKPVPDDYLDIVLERIAPGFKEVFQATEGNLALYPAFLKAMVRFQPYHHMQ